MDTHFFFFLLVSLLETGNALMSVKYQILIDLFYQFSYFRRSNVTLQFPRIRFTSFFLPIPWIKFLTLDALLVVWSCFFLHLQNVYEIPVLLLSQESFKNKKNVVFTIIFTNIIVTLSYLSVMIIPLWSKNYLLGGILWIQY